jgi:serine/threonine protein phosphatase PrpC
MTMATPITVATLSDVGKARQQNEDSRGETETAGGNLLIVCDGMGGHEAGEVASRIAVEAITQIFKNSPSEDPAERLKAGFLVANQRILAHAEKGNIESMGTTAVAAFVRDGKAWIAHVGDSRCYQLRGGEVVWKTADHTRVQKMIERGIITADQAKTHEDANVVTRALGFAKGEDKPEPDVASARELLDGDLLLLCSDGLYDLVKDEEIAELGSEASLDESTKTLVDLANKRGGHDNITVTILRHGAVTKRSGSRKTDFDAAGPDKPLKTAQLTKSPVSADEVAKARAEAKAATDAAQRARRALILVVAGIALLGIAGAAFVVTRGGDDPAPKAATRDAGSGSAAVVVEDAGAAQAAVVDAALPVSDAGTSGKTTGGGNKKIRDGGVGVAAPLTDAGTGAAPSGTGPVLPADAAVAGSGPTTTTTTGGGGFGTAAPLGKADAGVANIVKPPTPPPTPKTTPPATTTPKAGTAAPATTTPKAGTTTPPKAGTAPAPTTGGTPK